MQTITYTTIKSLTVMNLVSKIPFCFVNKLGVEIRVTKCAGSYFVTADGLRMSMTDIKETMVRPNIKKVAPVVAAPVVAPVAAPIVIDATIDTKLSIKDLSVLLKKANDAHKKALAKVQETKSRAEYIESLIVNKKDNFDVIRVTPSESKTILDCDLDNLYSSADISDNFEPIAQNKIELIGVSRNITRFLFEDCKKNYNRSTELFIFRKKA